MTLNSDVNPDPERSLRTATGTAGPELIMNFEELAFQRHLLQEFCHRHARTLFHFRDTEGPGFKLNRHEAPDHGLHLTTSATCIESLLSCPKDQWKSEDRIQALASDFAKAALEKKEWTSEESAQIYCRCRALPLTIAQTTEWDKRIEEHIRRIFRQLKHDPKRFAIGEADVGEGNVKLDEPRPEWYPPNAFHTFWALKTLRELERSFSAQYEDLKKDLELERVEAGMLLWSRRTLGYQVALHRAESSILDTDQLAWSLATLLAFDKPLFPADLGDQDLLRESLACLFGTQLRVGTWRHYRSLFHYRKAGNAYCYVYETFAALLQIALDGQPGRKLLIDSLYPHGSNLVRLWRYAESTRIAIDPVDADKSSAAGWCSGHRLNQNDPESWATASVLSFSQSLRRLLGVWTRDAATKKLNLLKPTFVNARERLMERGDTWIEDGKPRVTDLLYTMFINPVLMNGRNDTLDPDSKPITDHQSRSAILFGPPGTSKTTLCEAVATAIGWDYIELHASHFVADGLHNVQRTADDIFRRLMEIDHAVVLFDEIDELVREREDEHDAFGRFLTTSMLPKLAELWEQRKTIYFIATNHIKYFDRAITRSQRFDALVLVSPPSYERKTDRMRELLNDIDCGALFTTQLRERMWEALTQAGKPCDGSIEATKRERDRPIDVANQLAKFVLLRWDQLDELAFRIKEERKEETQITERTLKEALSKVADRKLLVRAPYMDFLTDLQYPRRDYDKELVWAAEGVDRPQPPELLEVNGKLWLVVRRSDRPLVHIGEFSLSRVENGTVQYTRRPMPNQAPER